jgi:putative Ca2+/H+ antiporter (TMEM165/GDT1 family)
MDAWCIFFFGVTVGFIVCVVVQVLLGSLVDDEKP